MDIPLFLLGLNVQGGASDPLAAFPLALDFKNGAYWKAGTQAASLSAMAGYSYTRTGQWSFVNSGGTVVDFAANVPPILAAIGYETYGSVISFQTWSNDQTQWSHTAASVTATGVTAPDGTTTAQTITCTAAGNNALRSATRAVTAGDKVTFSGWVRSSNAVLGTFLWNGAGNGANNVAGGTFAITSAWTRIVKQFTVVGNDSGLFTILQFHTGEIVDLWGCQLVTGDFSDGGPIIATAAAAVTIGAQTLSVSVPNATYSAVYTFSDNSTQTISTVVSGGAFTMPAYPATLNYPTVSRVTLT